MKKYLLLSIALVTPQLLFANQGTEISPTESAHQLKVADQETQISTNKEYSLIDVVIGRIQNSQKLSSDFKEACVSCGGEALSSFKARTLSPEQMSQVASAVKEFGQQHNIAPELKYFQNK